MYNIHNLQCKINSIDEKIINCFLPIDSEVLFLPRRFKQGRKLFGHCHEKGPAGPCLGGRRGLCPGRSGGLRFRDEERRLAAAVDPVHAAHHEEKADEADEYGACGKRIAQRENHAVPYEKPGRARRQFNFLYEKISYFVLYQPVRTLSTRRVRLVPSSFDGPSDFRAPSGSPPFFPEKRRRPGFASFRLPALGRGPCSTFARRRERHLSTGPFACVTYFFLVYFHTREQGAGPSVFHHLFSA